MESSDQVMMNANRALQDSRYNRSSIGTQSKSLKRGDFMKKLGRAALVVGGVLVGTAVVGAVLNGISTFFLNKTKDIVPNWLIDSPHSHFCYGYNAPTIPIEVIVRGYICGSMWRAYENGERIFCGNRLPDGLQNNQKLESPIITPTTKALEGHDENISEEEILKQGIVTKADWKLIKSYAFKLFQFGTEYAASKNLILVDTKFEFGRKKNNEIIHFGKEDDLESNKINDIYLDHLGVLWNMLKRDN